MNTFKKSASQYQEGFTIECKIDFQNGRSGQKRSDQDKGNNNGRIPRISKLMALAIHFEQLVKNGTMKDYADLARLGHVTRARMSQIMNMTLLAPDIIEDILHLPKTVKGRDPITEREIRSIIAELDWNKQRSIWNGLSKTK